MKLVSKSNYTAAGRREKGHPRVNSVNSSVTIDASKIIGPVNRRLFGGFVEHMGRGVHGGIYDPSHSTSDEDGFRQDVIELVKELGMTVFRYPGGNFVSGFRWEDSVGPRETRPRRLNLPWHSTETNAFGLHEFMSWVGKVNGEAMLAVNLGTRGIPEAVDLLEYSNVPGGTELSERRRTNGSYEPFDIRMWCLGNELDGPWQLGQMTADEYGRIATRTAKALRRVDPTLELVVCGSSGSWMPTFGPWERTVLGHSYEDVDYISCHAYYEPKNGDMRSYLASGASMETYILDVVRHADAVRDELGSSKTLQLSFDEWNIWYHSRMVGSLPTGIANWPEAPAISEDDYTVADGVVLGDLLISLLTHVDRVTTACLAQVVNVIAPIAAPTDAPAWRKTTFYPFSLTARFAKGDSLDTVVESPKVATEQHGDVDVVHAAAVNDAESGGVVVFVVNRSLEEAVTTTIELTGFEGSARVLEAVTLSDADMMATNSADAPERIVPQVNGSARAGIRSVVIELPPVSWTMVRIDVTG